MQTPRNKKISRIVVGIVTFAIAGIAVLTRFNDTQAKDTLPGIEKVVADNNQENTFDIVEVVPDAKMGEIGYYIGGKEPIDWKEELGKQNSHQKRMEYMESLYKIEKETGKNTGLLASITSENEEALAPLTYRTYEEKTILTEEEQKSNEWNVLDYSMNPSVEFLKGYYALKVNADGSVEQTGDYQRVAQNATYEVASDKQDANYIQNVQSFVYSDKSIGDYDVAFAYDETHGEYEAKGEAVVLSDSTLLDRQMLYQLDESKRYIYTGTKAEIIAAGKQDATTYYKVRFNKMEHPTGMVYAIMKQVYLPNTGQYQATLNKQEPYLEVPKGKGEFVCSDQGEVHYEYTPGMGRYQWIYDDKQGTLVEVLVGKVYYKGGFTNREWFKQYIMDLDPEQYGGFYTNVTTCAPQKLEGMDLASTDLVYLSGKNTSFTADKKESIYVAGSNDISWEKALNIIDGVLKDGMPVIVDAGILTDEKTESNPSNMKKLAGVLLQENIEDFYTKHNMQDVKALSWNEIEAGIKKIDEMNFVNNNVYCFENQRLVNANLDIAFSEDKIKDAFQQVLDEIQAENFYRENDSSGNYAKLDEKISQAVAIKYIINYANKRPVVYKKDIKILEIQPTSSFELTEEKVKKLLGKSDSTELVDSKIHITQMSTAEFIGKIEDLNSTYDMIYMGMDTSKLNTDQNGDTVFNDGNMNGLVYFNIGDKVYCDSCVAGILDTDYIDGNRHNFVYKNEFAKTSGKGIFKITENLFNKQDYIGWTYDNTLNRKVVSKEIEYDDIYAYRYNGNDITKEKEDDLREFVDAGYPVVFADEFYKKVTSGGVPTYEVNDKKVDTASRIYNFVEENIEKNRKNVLRYSNIGGALFARYINIPKLKIDLAAIPNTDENGIVELTSNNGVYTMDYDFVISNNAAISQVTTRYDCKLFIDINADGKYSNKKEEITDIVITRNTDKVQINPVYSVSESGEKTKQYQLEAGVSYHLTRTVPEGYKGVLPWKIEITETDNRNIRNNVSGYIRLVQSKSDLVSKKEEIKVLQIAPQGGVSVNLTDDKLFEKWIKEVEDFNISINYIKSDVLAKEYKEGYFDEYNMLILGFADTYEDISNEKGAVDGILKFIKSGKSVLFTHDTTSFINVNPNNQRAQGTDGMPGSSLNGSYSWGYNINQIVRDEVGMDRYGVTTEDLQFLRAGKSIQNGSNEWNVLQNSGRDIAYTPRTALSLPNAGTAKELEGYTYTLLNKKRLKDVNGYLNLKGIDTPDVHYATSEIKQINQGQITTYPFKIKESFEVANTHGQYYQLDLSSDKDGDDESDIVVWYTLEGAVDGKENDAYQMSSGDVMNNYYIYTKGNITYSGVGHSPIDNDEEARLFINTMIAAYSAGFKDPEVYVVESKDISSRQVENYYVSYDTAIPNYKMLEQNQTIYYYASDANLARGTKRIQAKYYYEDPNGNSVIQGVQVSELECQTYHASTNTIAVAENIESNEVYKFDVPLSIFQANDQMRVFIEIQSHIEQDGNVWDSQNIYDAVNIVRTELFDLD